VEDVVVKTLAETCPVIAIGKPSDPMPPVGAARLYCNDETKWRIIASNPMEHASLIVLRPAASEGVQWELKQILSDRFLSKCALLLVSTDGLPFSKSAYANFRSTIADFHRFELPVLGWNSWYFYFNSEGNMTFADADTAASPEEGLALATSHIVAVIRFRDLQSITGRSASL
jgi:hypothetical protein